MNKLLLITGAAFFAFLNFTNAQTLQRLSANVTVNGLIKKSPFAGGLNLPQFSEIDLNGDGIKDLYIFDRSGNVSLTFLNKGTANQTDYSYAPQYEAYFPADLTNFVLLRDFDGDGIPDIFTYANEGGAVGVRVFKGRTTNGHIEFQRFQFFGFQANIISYPLYNLGRSNLYVNSADMPAVEDMDGDGDLDILSWNTGGGNVIYYKNLSVEKGYKRDSLIFEQSDDCWGKFFDSGASLGVHLGGADSCAQHLTGGLVTRHAGSSLAVLRNAANPKKKDLLFGSISYDGINRLINNADSTKNLIVAQQPNFPIDHPIKIPLFPAVFFADVDNDGKKDMLAAANGGSYGEDYYVSWFYKNIGTDSLPVFQYKQNDFLTRDMLDLGENTNPAFFDYNNDGLTDLVVGYEGYDPTSGLLVSRLALFLNKGAAVQPAFELTDKNWLHINDLPNKRHLNLHPAFGDMDGDGDVDLLIGEEGGTLLYVENTAAPGAPFQAGTIVFNYMNLSPGASCAPQIVDLNGDGLPDIAAGNRTGYISYYQNKGNKIKPAFDSIPTNARLGQVDVRESDEIVGYAAPCFVSINRKTLLFCGSISGKLKLYDQIDGNLSGSFRKINNDYGRLKIGALVAPTLRDVNNDGSIDLMAGNQRGGLSFFDSGYHTDGTTESKEIIADADWKIFPNPVQDQLHIVFGSDFNPDIFPLTVTILNGLGEQVFASQIRASDVTVSTAGWANGMYIIEIQNKEGRGFRKFLKSGL